MATEVDYAEEVPSYLLPDEVKEFVVTFQRAIDNKNTSDIQSCYEYQFRRLTERFFKDQSWPTPEMISRLVKNDQVFLMLYKELYFRHIYQKLQPTVEQRFASYDNYIELFNFILESDGPVDLDLPNKWLWDIIEEFIYQFQSFTQYRCQLSKKSADELALLKDNPQIWDIYIVLNVLHTLIQKSNINEQLQAYQKGENPQEVAGEFGSLPLYKMLGYFSLVGLLRLHTLLGDYHLALKVVENIELHKKGLYSRVLACQLTIYHNIGFCYLMMRRYQDAIHCFASMMLHLQRQYSRSFDFMGRRRDHFFSLLAICVSLCPQRLEDSIQSEMNKRFGDKLHAIRDGDMSALEDLFKTGCPRFLSPVHPDIEDDYDEETAPKVVSAFDLQFKLFKRELDQQNMLATIRSYLKLYKSMPLAKLAVFLDVSEAKLRKMLHNFKHKSTQLVWQSGAPLEGERTSVGEVDFYIDNDMIYNSHVKVSRTHGHYFIRQATKFTSEK